MGVGDNGWLGNGATASLVFRFFLCVLNDGFFGGCGLAG